MKGGNLNFGPLLKIAQAAEETSIFDPIDDLENQVSSLAINTVVVAAVALLVLIVVSMIVKDRVPKLKMPLFVLMTISMAGSVLVLFGSTIYLNVNSDSGGPVHWHADIEYWACGNELELRDPVGFSNKIGTWTLHEHDDHRIHLEGVVVEEEIDASLGKFMFVIGGEVTDSTLVVPLNPDPDLWYEDEVDGDGPSSPNPGLVAGYISDLGEEEGVKASFKDGLTCGEEEAEVQTFVYHYEEEFDVYWQEKLSNTEFYSINREPIVPPGDCVIFEFDVIKERTDKLCAQYGIRDIDRCEEFGVESSKRGICTMREVGRVTEAGQIIELQELEAETTDTEADVEPETEDDSEAIEEEETDA